MDNYINAIRVIKLGNITLIFVYYYVDIMRILNWNEKVTLTCHTKLKKTLAHSIMPTLPNTTYKNTKQTSNGTTESSEENRDFL